MSNDTKLWVARAAVLLCLLVDLWLLGKVTIEAIKMAGQNGDGHPVLWFVLFTIAVIANFPLYIFYRRASAARWNPLNHKTEEQVEIEILAAAAKITAEEKAKYDASHGKTPPQA
jgi:heme/copper-type cytochrome/quinol oxidase subunit 2